MMQSVSLRQSLQQTQRLTQAQRLLVAQRVLQVRLEIVEAVWGARYSPKATCPSVAGCGRELTPIEILKGFLDDPNDFTTGCPGCGHRFQPILKARFRSGSAEIPFYCSLQVLEGLKEKDGLTYDELNKECPALLHSAMVHFGNIAAAFNTIGCEYSMDVNLAWKEKVRPFLGKVHDTVIAKIVGVSRSAVRRSRLKHSIKPYKASDWVD